MTPPMGKGKASAAPSRQPATKSSSSSASKPSKPSKPSNPPTSTSKSSKPSSSSSDLLFSHVRCERHPQGGTLLTIANPASPGCRATFWITLRTNPDPDLRESPALGLTHDDGGGLDGRCPRCPDSLSCVNYPSATAYARPAVQPTYEMVPQHGYVARVGVRDPRDLRRCLARCSDAVNWAVRVKRAWGLPAPALDAEPRVRIYLGLSGQMEWRMRLEGGFDVWV